MSELLRRFCDQAEIVTTLLKTNKKNPTERTARTLDEVSVDPQKMCGNGNTNEDGKSCTVNYAIFMYDCLINLSM